MIIQQMRSKEQHRH